MSAAPDILRLEHFGALFFRRRTGQYTALTPGLARFLIAARETSAIDLFAARPERLGFSDEEFAVEMVTWQREGLLDQEFRCRAQVVDGERPPGALTGPTSTGIYLTTACNLRCEHCFVPTTGPANAEQLSRGILTRLFSDLAELGSPLVVLAGGEPLLRPDLFEILEECQRHHLEVALCTNATTIDADRAGRLARAGLFRLSVSLDGPDAASHDALRAPGSFERALIGLRHLEEAGVTGLQLRVTITAPTLGRLEEFGPLASRLGVDELIIKPFRQTGTASTANHLALCRDAYQRACDAARDGWDECQATVTVSDGMPTRLPEWTGIMPAFCCTGGTMRATVLADGRVVPCAAVSSAEDWRLGDHRFAECWRAAPVMQEWRNLTHNETCRACARLATCGGGCRARALAAAGDLSAPDPWAGCPAE